MLRDVRRRWTAKAVYTARAVAPFLPPGWIWIAERWMKLTGPSWPVLSRMVADNMRSAGVYERAAVRAYFAQIARHMANGARIFRLARRNGAVGRLARAQIDVDGSISYIHQALAHGHGAIVAPPHVCNYLVTLARLNQEVPLRVYLRWSGDERNRDLKRAWCAATGLDVILEPANATDPASRAAACVEALRDGAALVMTPDIAQKSDKGVGVRLLGREVYLPTGPASIAMLAEAPLVPVFGRLVGKMHVIRVCEPVFVEPLARAEGGRRGAIQRAMQSWADDFEAFLRECPQAWFLWGDSRWTRVFRGDPRYCGVAESSEGEAGRQRGGGVA